MIVIVWI